MTPWKKIYRASPIWLQTVAVNLYSARRYRRKYGRYFRPALERLAANERKPREQLLEEQHAAVKELLQYARQHVPFYRQLGELPDELSAWPIIDRQHVIAAPEQFLSDEFRGQKLPADFTSGTTGTPLTVQFSPQAYQTEMAFRWRHRAWAGLPVHARAAYVGGPYPVVTATQTRPPFWRMDYRERRMILSVYHLSKPNLPAYVAALEKHAPEFVTGFPSALSVLAQHMVEQGVRTVRPRAVFCASETLLDFQRTAIEAAFGTKLFNWYGNTEMVCNIIECPAGRLHHRPDYGVLEVAEDGTLVGTGLHNRAMPMIRYRVGDVVTLASAGATCPCGCAFPVVERIEGRDEDYVRTPDGRWVGRLDSIMNGASHIREAQIVQRQLDEIVMRIVRADGFGPHDEEVIRYETRNRLGAAMRVRLEYVEALPRTPRGKLRFVVSELPDDPR